MSVKNPGSIWALETYSDGAFMRAILIPNVGIHIVKNTRRLFGFDGAHLKGEMNQYGVFLVATAKDFDKSIVPFTFSIVPKENYDHWCWFLRHVKEISQQSPIVRKVFSLQSRMYFRMLGTDFIFGTLCET
ncbi:unnamed protein product [Phytophthora fragariaefolia]|uniref:Unnamed protein product n=1 Tax=Phytophthora fragariaefolia TaxID=1490495 RepID=A0A9W6XK68_9STRA|nr:unnamed protein product [Phytophthora fragariaefolia]